MHVLIMEGKGRGIYERSMIQLGGIVLLICPFVFLFVFIYAESNKNRQQS